MKIVRPFAVTVDSLADSNVAIAEADWNAATNYTIGQAVKRTINGIPTRFEALTNNSNKTPEDNPSDWQDKGAVERFKMFDQAIQSQTTNADEIEVEIDITGRIDTVALLNISAQSARLVLTDADEGVVYDEEFGLTSAEGINNWAAYFREPIERLSELIVTDLPPYNNPTLEVSLEGEGETVKAGALIPGYSKVIGETIISPRLGIIDYSVKETTEFGDKIVIERPYSDTAEFQILVENSFVDRLKRLLTTYRAKPLLYIGDERFAATAVYGFFREFNIEIAYPTHSLTTLSLEGLT